jgi:hypothetical protein
MSNNGKNFAIIVLVCAFSACRMTPEEQFVRQSIPVQIQNGRTLTFEIKSLSGNGSNDVGIRCSPEVWKMLTNSTKEISVRLKASSKPDTRFDWVKPDQGGAFFGHLTNVHYIFMIGGRHRCKATMEITFPNGPEKATRAEIIIGQTPADTAL